MREPDKSIIASLEDSLQMACEYAKRGPCWTLWNDATPVACAGIIMYWSGVGEAWAATSVHVSKFPVGFHRAAKQALATAMTQFKIHRLQVSIPVTHKTSRRWIMRLGFEIEGKMKKYGPARDTWISYVRFSCPS